MVNSGYSSCKPAGECPSPDRPTPSLGPCCGSNYRLLLPYCRFQVFDIFQITAALYSIKCIFSGERPGSDCQIVGLSSRAQVARALGPFPSRRVAVRFLNVCFQSSRCDLAQVGYTRVQVFKASSWSVNPSHRNVMVS